MKHTRITQSRMEEIQHGDLTRAAEFWQMIHGREECHNAVAADRVEECHNVDEANALTEEDGWFKVSPYGEFPGKIPSLLQEAEAMLPEKIGNEAFDDEVTRLLTEAFLGQGEEVENADRGKPLGYFFSNGIRRPIYAAKYGTPLSVKWQSQTMSYSKQAGSIMAAITAEKNKEQGAAFSMGRVDEAVAAKVLEATSAHGEPRDIKNFEWRIDSDFVAHARKYHPNLTDDDFLRIPQMIAKAPVILPGESTAGLPSINFKIKRSEREFLLVGVQLNKQGQVAMRTLKKSAQGKSLL